MTTTADQRRGAGRAGEMPQAARGKRIGGGGHGMG